jgi:hypothetical protein
MRTNQKPLVLGILFFLTIALAVALLTHENDPKYNGVSIAFLLNQAIDRQVFDANLAFRTRHTGWVPDPVAEEAFRRVGTNALPYLLKTDPLRSSSSADRTVQVAYRTTSNSVGLGSPEVVHNGRDLPSLPASRSSRERL